MPSAPTGPDVTVPLMLQSGVTPPDTQAAGSSLTSGAIEDGEHLLGAGPKHLLLSFHEEVYTGLCLRNVLHVHYTQCSNVFRNQSAHKESVLRKVPVTPSPTTTHMAALIIYTDVSTCRSHTGIRLQGPPSQRDYCDPQNPGSAAASCSHS